MNQIRIRRSLKQGGRHPCPGCGRVMAAFNDRNRQSPIFYNHKNNDTHTWCPESMQTVRSINKDLSYIT